MVKVKMKIHGMYGGISFQMGDVVEFSEEALKGLDAKDYEIVSEEKNVEKSSDKMQKAKGKKIGKNRENFIS